MNSQGNSPFPDPDKAYEDSLLGGGSSSHSQKSGRPTEQGVKTPFGMDRNDADTVAMDYSESLLQSKSGAALAPFDLRTEMAAVDLRRNAVIGNRFRVMKPLGHGGMGAVYLVEDMRLNDEKALKVMLPSLVNSPEAQRRFILEIKALQRLTHDGIVRVYDYGTDAKSGTVFFTMEYVQGQTLAEILRKAGGVLSVQDAVTYILKLLMTLQYAHKTIIHRDLKPQNIMVRPDGSVLVLDFGLAKMMTPDQMTQSNMAMGTAYYQSPEQTIRPGEVDKRADLYSVGVILYQLLVGEVPAGKIRPPSKLNPQVPRRLDHVILRCLESRPEDRYSDAHDLEMALRRAVRKSNTRTYALAGALVVSAAALGAIFAVSPQFLGTGATAPADSSEAPALHAAEDTASIDLAAAAAPSPMPGSVDVIAGADSSASQDSPAPTVKDAVTIRSSAEQARNEALASNASVHGQAAHEEAEIAWTAGEVYLEAEQWGEAMDAFARAERAYTTAAIDARRVMAAQLSDVGLAEERAETAHAQAIEMGAEQFAPGLYRAGAEAFTLAAQHKGAQRYLDAAEAFQESEKFLLEAADSVDVTARRAEVTQALASAEESLRRARDGGADGSDVFKAAESELAQGRQFFDENKLAHARDSLEKAEKGFVQAARDAEILWGERMKTAKAAVTRARNDADAVTASRFAAEDYEKAKTLQARGETAQREGRFAEARNYFDQSVKTFLGASKAAQEAAAESAAPPAPMQEPVTQSIPATVDAPAVVDAPVQTAKADVGVPTVNTREDVVLSGVIRRVELGLEGQRFTQGQRIPVKSPGGAGDQTFVWSVNGREVARGGMNSVSLVAESLGDTTIRMREYYQGTLHQDVSETFQVVPEPVVSHAHPLDVPLNWGDNVTQLSGYDAIEWRLDGQVVSTSRTLNHNFSRAGTYNLVCRGSNPKDPNNSFAFRQITFSLSVK